MADEPMGERVKALEVLLPRIMDELQEIKGDVKALRNGNAVKATVLEAVRMIGALVAGLFGGKLYGGQ